VKEQNRAERINKETSEKGVSVRTILNCEKNNWVPWKKGKRQIGAGVT